MVSVSLVLARDAQEQMLVVLHWLQSSFVHASRLFHGQAWRRSVPIKCGWMWLRGRIAKGTERELQIQSQVSAFSCHSPGCQIAYFVQHDLEWVLLKSSFLFPCSLSHGTSYSSVLLFTFLQHLHLPLSHFPDGPWVSTVWQAAGLPVLWTAHLQELSCLMSSVHE